MSTHKLIYQNKLNEHGSKLKSSKKRYTNKGGGVIETNVSHWGTTDTNETLGA